MTRLQLSESEMTELAERATAMIVRHLRDLPTSRVGTRADAAALLAAVGPIPEEPLAPDLVLERLDEAVLPFAVQQDHPRYLATVPSPGNFVAAVGDMLAAGFNVFAGNWSEGGGAAAVELALIDWLAELCGLPPGRAGGLFVSGGTLATVTALVIARRSAGAPASGAVVYCSEEAHSCVDRAALVAGLDRQGVARVPVDAEQRIDTAALATAIAADRAHGRTPLMVVGNAGSTSTGAVDPLGALAAICRRERLWLHVDAAYGSGALLSERGRALFAGIDHADSVALDPHKWLFQPFGLGCLLVRDVRALESTFRDVPAYLEGLAGAEGEVDFYDRGIEVSRPFRALRLWLSLQTFGARAFREAVERGLELAETAAAEARAQDGIEVVTGPRLTIVCVRCDAAGSTDEQRDAATEEAVARLNAGGRAVAGCTRVGGRVVARLCTLNPRTTDDDIRGAIAELASHARGAAACTDRPTVRRDFRRIGSGVLDR
jgi:aromatic-L-amino-acid decarboxylase